MGRLYILSWRCNIHHVIISLLDILPWGISMLESTGFAAHHFTQTVDDHIVQFGRSIGEK